MQLFARYVLMVLCFVSGKAEDNATTPAVNLTTPPPTKTTKAPAPEILSHSSSEELVFSGTTLKLMCKFTKSAVKTYWTNDRGEKIQNNVERVTSATSVTVTLSVVPKNSQVYTCGGENELGEKVFENIEVVVQEKRCRENWNTAENNIEEADCSSKPNSQGYVLDTRCKFVCLQGHYKAFGAAEIKCIENNTWSETSAFCKALPNGRNVTVMTYSADSFRISWTAHDPEDLQLKSTDVIYWQATDAASKLTKRADGRTEITIDELMPYTTYTFYVQENFGVQGGVKGVRSNNVTVHTRQAAPSAPKSLTATTTTENSITVQWQQPEKHNGILTTVVVTYSYDADGHQISRETPLPPTTLWYTIPDLLPNVQYKVVVRWKTIAYGPDKKIMTRTQMGKPHSAPDSFKAAEVGSSFVKLSWDELPQHLSGGKLTGYTLKISPLGAPDESDGIFIDTVSQNGSLTKIIKGLKPYTNYTITILAVNEKHGGGPSIEIHVQTKAAKPSAPQNVTSQSTIVVRDGELRPQVTVIWAPPAYANGRLLEYKLTFWKVKACRNKRCTRDVTQRLEETGQLDYPVVRMHKIEHILDAFSLFRFYVQEKTSAGWGDGSPIHEVQTHTTRPSEPLNLMITELFHDSVEFGWSPPQHPNGVVSKYYIYTYGETNIPRYEFTVFNDTAPLQYKIINLQSEAEYKIHIAAFNNFKGGVSSPLTVVTKPEPTLPWVFVVIGILVIVLLISIILTIVLLVRRRNRNYTNVKTTEELELEPQLRSKPIRVNDLKQYCEQLHANGDLLFQQEYESLKAIPQSSRYETSKMDCNQSKNRYCNILAYDHSRVELMTLNQDPSTGYINANFISGYKNPRAFIATQGPLPETVIDFWRLVWETESAVIVMLTNLMEDTKIKCEQYWPQGKGLQYKDIVVTVESVKEMTDYTVRSFTIHKFNHPEYGTRHVRQYHFTTWPDHGVPTHPTSYLSFTRHVMSYLDTLESKNNVIVHCSAGVGRTGTFIAIETCLRQIEVEECADVYGTVYQMRLQRNFMVQTELQYTFIYDSLLDSVICGNTEIVPVNLSSKMRYLKETDPASDGPYYASEFKRLESGMAASNIKPYAEASAHDNKNKNRFFNVLPYDKNRVRLAPIAGSRQSDYINASLIDGFQQRGAFIATQGPLENTVVDFWRMVLEKKCNVIVMLTRLEERGQGKCYLYWPQADAVSYGTVNVELLGVQQEQEYLTVHKLRITNNETGRSWLLTHFWYTGWPETGPPESGHELIRLIGHVQKTHQDSGGSSGGGMGTGVSGGPILVHCSNGVGRTGVFMSVYNSIERLKIKGVVDIFQSTRALRLQRTAMVQTVNQYMFCYTALRDYLDSFDLAADAKC